MPETREELTIPSPDAATSKRSAGVTLKGASLFSVIARV
jgi:hypothetical protein